MSEKCVGQHLKGRKVKSGSIVSSCAAGSPGDFYFRNWKDARIIYLCNKTQVQMYCPGRTQALGLINK